MQTVTRNSALNYSMHLSINWFRFGRHQFFLLQPQHLHWQIKTNRHRFTLSITDNNHASAYFQLLINFFFNRGRHPGCIYPHIEPGDMSTHWFFNRWQCLQLITNRALLHSHSCISKTIRNCHAIDACSPMLLLLQQSAIFGDYYCGTNITLVTSLPLKCRPPTSPMNYVWGVSNFGVVEQKKKPGLRLYYAQQRPLVWNALFIF